MPQKLQKYGPGVVYGHWDDRPASGAPTQSTGIRHLGRFVCKNRSGIFQGDLLTSLSPYFFTYQLLVFAELDWCRQPPDRWYPPEGPKRPWIQLWRPNNLLQGMSSGLWDETKKLLHWTSSHGWGDKAGDGRIWIFWCPGVSFCWLYFLWQKAKKLGISVARRTGSALKLSKGIW